MDLLPAAGVFTPLAVVIIYLLRQNALDRKFYREDGAAIVKRYDAELAAKQAENDALDARLDEERRRRRQVEDDADMGRRRAGITEGTHE